MIKWWKYASFVLIFGCILKVGHAQDADRTSKCSFTVEFNFGQLTPIFSAYPNDYTLTSSGYYGLSVYSNIVDRGHWAIFVGGGTFINHEKWWRMTLTEQDILMGTESRADSRVHFYGIELLVGFEKRFFRDKVSLRGSQGLFHVFGVQTKHVYSFGYSGETTTLDDFPYHLPKLNTVSVLAASYNLGPLIRRMEVGLSLQHFWRPMHFLLTSSEGARSHYLIHGRYTF